MSQAATRVAPALVEPVAWGAWAMAIGAAGVVVTSILYALSPPQVALPLPGVAVGDAMRQAVAGAGTMRAAGTVGLLSDMALIAGGLILAAGVPGRGDPIARLGWALVAAATIPFVIVDALVGFVLPPLAVQPGAEAAFAGLKMLFDVSFALGTLAFGSALLALAVGERRRGARLLAGALLLAAAVAAIGATGYFVGSDLARLTGIAVALGSALVAMVAVGLARRAA
jgi:hypothetical protein